MATTEITVEGLKEFNKALEGVEKGLKKSTRLALNEAADLVVKGARPKVPQRSGKAARSIKAASTQTQSRVSGGGGKASYYPWLDFGGRVGRGHAVKRKYTKDGRYIYPTYRRLRDGGQFQDKLQEVLTDLGRRNGLEIEPS